MQHHFNSIYSACR